MANTLSLKLTDPSGEPIADAKVSVFALAPSGNRSMIVTPDALVLGSELVSETDAAGRVSFLLAALPVRYILRVRGQPAFAEISFFMPNRNVTLAEASGVDEATQKALMDRMQKDAAEQRTADDDEAPADEAPADEAPADEAPADEAPADEAPADDAPTTVDGEAPAQPHERPGQRPKR